MSACRLAAVSAALVLAACAGGKAAAPVVAGAAVEAAVPAVAVAAQPAQLPATGLELSVVPANAEVFVDGDSRGVVADLSSGILGLAPGIYQVSLKAPGHVTWRAEVAVRAGREKIAVRLATKDAAAR